MNLRRLAAVLLGLAAIAAVGFCFYIYTSEDRQAPEISYDKSVEAVLNGADEAVLLADVTAIDDRDGDVTSQVQLAEVEWNADSVSVVYVVKDSAGNIALKRRTLRVGEVEETIEEPEETQPETEEIETVPEITEEETEEESETETGSETETETVVSEIPVITLTQNHVVIPKGTEFSYHTFVSSIADDKDRYEDLVQNLVINGTYNVNAAGEYQLEYWTVDSDGNQSARQPFLLTVE